MAEQQIIDLGIVGIKNMGEYNSQTQYEKLNVVTYQGSSYCALKNTKGNLPTDTDYWQLYAQKGDTGNTPDLSVGTVTLGDEPDVEITGTTDEPVLNFTLVKGDKGDKGDTGNPGASPIAVTTTADMTDTTKIYVLSTDGHWYFYNNSQWNDGGVYQATADPEVEDIRETYDEVGFDTAGNSVRAQINQLREIHDNYTIQGLNRLKGEFVRGSGVSSSPSYRIRTKNKLKYPYPIKIRTFVGGFHNLVVTYESEKATTGTSILDKRGYKYVPANTYFMVTVRRYPTEDTTETADIYEFSKNALYLSEEKVDVNSLEQKINNNYANINTKLDSPFYSISQLEGTLTTGKLMGIGGSEYTSSGKEYLTITEGFNSGDFILVSGRSATNPSEYPLCFFVDSDGYLISTFGNTNNTAYVDEELIVPYGTATIYINGNTSIQPCDCKKKVYNTELDLSETLYPLNIAEALVREAKKNPFEFSTFDKGYVTFVFDDTRSDMDLVASIFAEYDFKLGLATIPSHLNQTCNGLNEPSQGYTPGMTRKAVCDRVVALGGEILSHNGAVINQERQYDYDFMYNYFVQTRKDLEANGYKVRGIIRAGGTGSISHTPEIEKWLIGNYEYSNQGTAINYSQDRANIASGVDAAKTLILNAYNNHTWAKFMGHGIASTTSGNQISVSDLREILSYCQTLGIAVVNYSDMFDNFSSSKLLNNIN